MTATVISTAEQGSAEWLDARRGGVGGSDVAAVLGMSPWATPLDVWLSKQPDHDGGPPSEPMMWGHRLEPVVRDHYQAQRPGTIVETVPGVLAHPTRNWMRASLDGLAHTRDETRLLEVKTSRNGFDVVPDTYVAQVQWCMAVCSLEVADVACLFAGNRYVEFEVEADLQVQRDMSDYVGWWWAEHVVAGKPPPIDPIRDAPNLSKVWQPEPGKTVDLDPDEVADLRDLKERADAAADEYAHAVALMQDRLADAEVGTVEGEPVITWKATKPRVTVDTARLKAAGLFDEYSRQGSAGRRFTVKQRGQ